MFIKHAPATTLTHHSLGIQSQRSQTQTNMKAWWQTLAAERRLLTRATTVIFRRVWFFHHILPTYILRYILHNIHTCAESRTLNLYVRTLTTALLRVQYLIDYEACPAVIYQGTQYTLLLLFEFKTWHYYSMRPEWVCALIKGEEDPQNNTYIHVSSASRCCPRWCPARCTVY